MKLLSNIRPGYCPTNNPDDVRSWVRGTKEKAVKHAAELTENVDRLLKGLP